MWSFITWSPTVLSLSLACGYVGCGVAVAAALARRGASNETTLSALALWPLLLPLLSSAAEQPPSGPLGERIDRAFHDLDAVISEVGGSPVDAAELRSLQGSLRRADERVALVDRWIDRERTSGEGAGLDALKAARGRAAADIEEVLAGIAELRLKIGLMTLAGDAGAVQEHLAQLRSRVSALEEVG